MRRLTLACIVAALLLVAGGAAAAAGTQKAPPARGGHALPVRERGWITAPLVKRQANPSLGVPAYAIGESH